MTALIIQSLLLMAIAYILGCILGCLFHQWFGTAEKAAVIAETPVIAAAASVPQPKPADPPPVPAAPPPPAPPEAKLRPPAPPPPPPAPKPSRLADPVAEPAAPKPAPKRVAKAKPRTKPVSKPRAKDDLKRIKGIGRQNEARLNAMGVTTFVQIAEWTKKEQHDLGERLAFPGRIEREEWVSQAAILAKGGDTQFSKRVGRGEIQSSVGKGSVGAAGKRPAKLANPRGGNGDNLTLIDGVGNALEKKLFALGIYHFDQIAEWTAENEAWIGNELGFPGRPERENWVKEAGILAGGGTTEHARRVEAGEISSSRKTDPDENA